MKTTMILAAALSALCLVACAPEAHDVGETEDALAADEPELRVDASWRRVVTGTPSIGFDATTPVVAIRARVNDAAVRRSRPGFDGYERVVAYVPRADGAQRVELGFRHTTQEGFMQLYPVDVHEAAPFYVTEAELAMIRRDGITVGLETNAGVVGGDNVVVVANNP